MAAIQQVAVVGGTHGNEFSGIYLIRHYQRHPELLQRQSFHAWTLFANPEAYRANKRYLDADLNRQFRREDLDNPALSNYEQSRAKVIDAVLGPKGNPKVDLVIDLHNTTSNMGPVLILTQAGDFYNQLAAYVKMKMPEAVISCDEDLLPAEEHKLLCTTGRYGVIVEVGPQPQSVLRQDVLEQMHSMTQHILDFADLYNRQALPALPSAVEAYRYLHSIKLPLNEQGERLGMVHSRVQDQDFKAIEPGEPIFKLFDGKELTYQGDTTVYPSFINEAAYYDNNLAMSLNEKITLVVPPVAGY